MASAVLGLIMLAVATAIATAQDMAFESQKRLLASIGADDLLAEIATLPYDDLPALNGRTSETGSMTSLDGDEYPDAFWPLGRGVTVAPETIIDSDSGVSVDGRLVTVACFDGFTTLAEYQLFVPDPTIELVEPEEEPEDAGGGKGKPDGKGGPPVAPPGSMGAGSIPTGGR